MMEYVAPTVDLERRLRRAASLLTLEFRRDFIFAMYDSHAKTLHGKVWSLAWRNGKAILM